jgi:dTDP-4-amino-4,6-dideoxygalactose transaminase
MNGFNAGVRGPVNVAEEIHKRGFNLPSYPDLKKKQLKYICDAVNKIVEGL